MLAMGSYSRLVIAGHALSLGQPGVVSGLTLRWLALCPLRPAHVPCTTRARIVYGHTTVAVPSVRGRVRDSAAVGRYKRDFRWV